MKFYLYLISKVLISNLTFVFENSENLHSNKNPQMWEYGAKPINASLGDFIKVHILSLKFLFDNKFERERSSGVFGTEIHYLLRGTS